MSASNEVVVDVGGEGKVKIIKTSNGPRIENGHAQLPLFSD
jgi:hypothetical protein